MAPTNSNFKLHTLAICSMSKKTQHSDPFTAARDLFLWILLILPISISIGLAVALFLWLLDVATLTRWNNMWLLFLLPVAGILIFFVYKFAGKNIHGGNNLIIDEIHQPGGGIPARMTPSVLLTTVITHLFGGSAGREGTAVQMGGSIASFFCKLLTVHADKRKILLMCGVAAGFGAVFGTPVAGAVFALEVLAIGRVQYEALIPCLMASIIADITCSSTGIDHTQYSIVFVENARYFKYISFDILLLFKVIAGGICFGFAALIFVKSSELVKEKSNQIFETKWMIPFFGGCLIIAMSYALGTFDYLGLGVTNPEGGISILSSFKEGGSDYFSWLWKIIFTAVTLGTGFKGGEVTPLFFIGSTLGNTLAIISDSPVSLFAALGFIAVFSGATNTPLACTFMGVELFGSDHIVYFAVACFTAYYFSGHKGIYSSQKLAVPKLRHTRTADN